MQNMKLINKNTKWSYFLIIIVLMGISLLTACGQKFSPVPDEQNTESPDEHELQVNKTLLDSGIKAIYLVPKKGGVIGMNELVKHQQAALQVAVVHTFKELKDLAVNMVMIEALTRNIAGQ